MPEPARPVKRPQAATPKGLTGRGGVGTCQLCVPNGVPGSANVYRLSPVQPRRISLNQAEFDPLGAPRNEGVPGSSPGVGFGKRPSPASCAAVIQAVPGCIVRAAGRSAVNRHTGRVGRTPGSRCAPTRRRILNRGPNRRSARLFGAAPATRRARTRRSRNWRCPYDAPGRSCRG
jgi:hypothetical protein